MKSKRTHTIPNYNGILGDILHVKAKYGQHNFLMTQKTDHVVNKWRNAQPPLLINVGSHIE